jgi:hypothetical protein
MERSSSEEPHEAVRSPFAGTQSTIRKSRKQTTPKAALTGAVIAGLLIIGVGIYLGRGTLDNPLRTLRVFPVDEYYSNHTSLEGTHFRADFKVLDQLGWNENIGRMVTVEVAEGKPVVIAIPQKFENIALEPGDHFETELLVGNGGLLKANFLRKN